MSAFGPEVDMLADDPFGDHTMFARAYENALDRADEARKRVEQHPPEDCPRCGGRIQVAGLCGPCDDEHWKEAA